MSWATLDLGLTQVLFGECANWGSGNPLSGCPANWQNTYNNGTVQNTQIYSGGPAQWQSLPQITQSFLYDGVNRLSWAGEANWSRSFGYDPYGNMWVTGWAGIQPAGNTPSSNIFNASTNQIIGFAYDAAGNLQSINGNSALYNAENEVVSVTEAPGFWRRHRDSGV